MEHLCCVGQRGSPELRCREHGAALLPRAPAFCLRYQQVEEHSEVESGGQNFRRATSREDSSHQGQNNQKFFCQFNRLCTSMKQLRWKTPLHSSPSVDHVYLSHTRASHEGRAASFCVTAVRSHCISGRTQTTHS